MGTSWSTTQRELGFDHVDLAATDGVQCQLIVRTNPGNGLCLIGFFDPYDVEGGCGLRDVTNQVAPAIQAEQEAVAHRLALHGQDPCDEAAGSAGPLDVAEVQADEAEVRRHEAQRGQVRIPPTGLADHEQLPGDLGGGRERERMADVFGRRLLAEHR